MYKLLIIVVGLVFTLVGCANSNENIQQPDTPIRIGVNSWVGVGPLYIADELGFFEEEGANIELSFFEDQATGMADLAQRKNDGSLVAFADLVGLVNAGVELQAVWVLDDSSGGDVLLSNGNIKRIEDLKGARIGLTRGSFSHLFVEQLLGVYNIQLDEVIIVDVGEADIPQALVDNRIDAGHTFGDFAVKALDNGAVLLGSTAETPGVILDTISFRQEIIEKYPDQITAILRATNRGYLWMQDNPEEAYRIIAKRTNITPEDVPISLGGMKLYSLEDNLQAFDLTNNSSSSIYTTADISMNFFLNIGFIEESLDINALVNGDFVKSLGG